MQAIVQSGYGGPEVLRLEEVPKPVPGDDEVLVRIRAASVNAMDWRLMYGKPALVRILIRAMRRTTGLARPGRDFAGTVEAVGRDVTRFRPGDAVFGVCPGAFAEYGCTREDRLAPKPAGVSFEAAAAVPVAGITALQGLRDRGGLREGQRVLVDGASGGVGTFAVQIARACGAHVTAVCSPGNVEAARAMGAERVIDYTRGDFAREDQRYDLILAANAHRPILDYRRALADDGVYVLAGGGLPQLLQGMVLGPLLSRFGRRQMRFVVAKLRSDDLAVLADMLADGRIVPAIERRYPLRGTSEAVRHVADGHARGKVVVDVLRAGEA